MQISMLMLIFSVFYQKCHFLAILVPKLIIACLKWNLVPGVIRICRIKWRSYFIFFKSEIPFWGANLVQTLKIVSLCWNLVHKLIPIWRILWGIINHRKIYSKNSKLCDAAEIWNVHYFEYVGFTFFFYFRSKIHFLG